MAIAVAGMAEAGIIAMAAAGMAEAGIMAVAETAVATEVTAVAGTMTVEMAASVMEVTAAAVKTGMEFLETAVDTMTVAVWKGTFPCLCLVMHAMARDMTGETSHVMPIWRRLPGRIIQCFPAGKAVAVRTDPGLGM